MAKATDADEKLGAYGREWLEAAKCGCLDAMRRLLSAHGAHLLGHRGKGCSLGFIGHSALHWSAAKGHMHVLEWLLEEGAEVGLINNAESTPLHTAAQNNHAAAVERLLSAGADAHARNAEGQTAREVALERDQVEVARLMESCTETIRLRTLLAQLAADDARWTVGLLKESLRLGGVDTTGVSEKAELVALVRELMEREGVGCRTHIAPPVVPTPEMMTTAEETSTRNAPTGKANTAAANTAAANTAAANTAAANTAAAAPPAAAPPADADADADEAAQLAGAERAKQKGNAAFAACDFSLAVKHFGHAIRLAPLSHVLYSNRSAAHASLGCGSQALQDAER